MSETARTMRTMLPRLDLVVVIVAGFCAQAVHAADDAAPQIAECRIGLDGTFKVGHWTPIWVDLSGDVGALKPTVEVTTIDSDGVAVSVSATPVSAATVIRSSSAKGYWPTLLYAKVGRLDASIAVRLVGENGRVLDRFEWSPECDQEDGLRYAPLPSTGELVVQIGGGPAGLAEAFAAQQGTDGVRDFAVSHLTDVDALPTDWFGYDAVDVLVLTTDDGEFCERLRRSGSQMSALRKWLELGGRLVLCAGRSAPEFLAEGKPLADFVPGKFVQLARLSQTQPLESFAGSGDPIGQSGVATNIPVAQITDVRGRVEAYGPGNNPLIVRAARGLGELVFVGVDLSEPSLAKWSGRKAFWQSLLKPYLADRDAAGTASPMLVSLGYDDLAGALRQKLGKSFSGVAAIGFLVVTALVIGYLLLLGPLDYLFVEKIVRRPWVAWLTLPLLVVGTSAGAFALAASAKKTAGQQLNSVELVDFDLTTGRMRGTCWTALYSAAARRFDVSLEARQPVGPPATNAQSIVSALGLPGSGLGGMHATGGAIDVAGVGYTQSANLNELVGLPVLTSSTKSLLAQWDGTQPDDATRPIAAALAVDDDGLLVGTLSNDIGAPLNDACLLYGQWGYRLGNLRPGQRMEIGPQLSAVRVKTIVARRAGYDVAGQRQLFAADRATAIELLNVMMFFTAVGGETFAGLPSRFQSDCDLSRLLELDRAILVANTAGRGSQWIDAASGGSLATEQDSAATVYRFVLPVDNARPTPGT